MFITSRNEFRQPIVTGTSVLAIKYKDGIMMAADNLGEHPIMSTKDVLLCTTISFVRFPRTIQGRPTSARSWQPHRHRRRRRHVRLPIHPKHSRRAYN